MTAGHDMPRDHAHDARLDATRDDHRDLRDTDARDAADGVVLHAEEMRVRTERVPSGRVTFRKRVVTEERTVVVTVRREKLEIIEDHDTTNLDAAPAGDEPSITGDRLAGAGEGADLEEIRRDADGDYEIVLHAEEPVVTLQTVPVERVRISRRTVTETEQVSADLAREQAVVEREAVDEHGRHDHR
ncbi:DUF2382 domain-containing protein [Mobilicoccus pelagius]|uniref:DUF2382 domain-containing protein n=1 Tax=Mobilicoccus pelagius NBRC 104925 TaxID=1089455 RepID=H5UR24_9MICO|nr:DUF2382 domain-containing protein [Mobilicoccus pelagius]GAB48182.1 hypothetical protein MOPEL_067_00310 [Mobilicoccus pelagius NBRC 104925]